MKKDTSVLLRHILDSIEAIERYMSGITKENFNILEEKQDSVIRRIEVIGEATKSIPEDFKKENPTIPWKRMAGMRDVLIHQYDDVDIQVVWKTITEFIPPLKTQIQKLLN